MTYLVVVARNMVLITDAYLTKCVTSQPTKVEKTSYLLCLIHMPWLVLLCDDILETVGALKI